MKEVVFIKKRTISIVLLLLMILGTFIFVSAESDYANHWASLEIQSLVDEGIVEGYPGGDFRPDRPVTRAEFMKMINGAFEFNKEANVPFTDVSESAWFYDYVAVAIGEGYTRGYDDNTVRPNKEISRQEAATMIGRALDLMELEQSDKEFSDSDQISNWAVKWINAVVEKGYMQGYTTGDFKPLDSITRAETAKIISNVLEASLEEDESIDALRDLKVHYIDVGQGDSTLIELPNGENMLIDGASRSKEEIVLNYLDSQNISKIDYLVATHPHEDHIGGLVGVVNKYDVGKIYMPKVTHTTQIYENLLLAISNKGLKITNSFAGQTILDKDGLSLNILAPENDFTGNNLNNYSIVIRLAYKNNSFLFTGDAESQSEYTMLNNGYKLKSDVLKVAHHGSNTSTTDDFLNKVDPIYAVISYGEGNRYNHPDGETINKLNAMGIEVIGTATRGNIIARSDGSVITFTTEN